MSKNTALEKLITKANKRLSSLEDEIKMYHDIDLRHIFFLLANKLFCFNLYNDNQTRIKEIYRELERIRAQIKAAIDTYSRELKKDNNTDKDSLGYISKMMQVLQEVSSLEERLHRKDIECITHTTSSSKSSNQKANDINWNDLDLNL